MDQQPARFTDKSGFVATVVLTAAVITIHYWEILKNLGTSLSLEPYRDGIKTVLNASWHAKYGTSYSYFEGMNYPYSEHIVAATELPGPAILLKWLTQFFPQLPDYTFGLFHAFLLLCILLGAVFLYLIFRDLHVPAWFSVPVVAGITFLAPQNMRLGPHMGLAPLFVIPAILYGLLQWERGRHLRATVITALTILAASLVHFYFFAITVFIVSLYFFFSALRHFNWQHIRRLIAGYLGMVIVPLVFFLYWMILSDPVTDRSPNPWGFFHYRAKWEAIFTSMRMPLFQWVDENIIVIEKTEFEGWAYVGLAAGLFSFVFLLKWLFSLFRKPLMPFIPERERDFFYPLLGAGVVLAFLSCSQPFATEGLEFLLDYAGPMRQFRSTGRFAWGFYFIINLIAFYGIYQIAKKMGKQWLRAALVAFSVSLLWYETYTFMHSGGHMYSPEKLRQVPELVPGQRFTDLPGIDYSRYQAILPITYYNVGSNNFDMAGGALIVQQSLVLSNQTGLPVTGAMLTRSSRSQAFRQMQLVTAPYRMPVIFEDYPNRDPLLMIHSAAAHKADSLRFVHLHEESDLLHENERWTLYEVEISDFQRRIDKIRDSLLMAASADSLVQVGDFLATSDTLGFIYESFDHLQTENTYLGPGAYTGNISELNTIFNGRMPDPHAWKYYEALLWVNVDGDRFSSTIFNLKEINADGAVLNDVSHGVRGGAELYDPSGWILVRLPFQLKSNESTLVLTLRLDNGGDRQLVADELLIRPVELDLYKSSADGIWWNDRYYYVD